MEHLCNNNLPDYLRIPLEVIKDNKIKEIKIPSSRHFSRQIDVRPREKK